MHGAEDAAVRRRRAPWRLVTGRSLCPFQGVLALCLSCASVPDDPASSPHCPGRTAQPLIGGTSEETYLGLSASQTRAVVELVEGSGTTGATCSGIAVSPSWVLTAAHCAAIPELAVRVQSAPDIEGELVFVARVERHVSVDLALLELDFSSLVPSRDLVDHGVTPVLTASVNLEMGVGDAVELAGFGRTESGIDSGLRFLVESIVAVDPTSFRVDGFGVTGACEGDSGGPLLTRSSDGSLVAAGILTAGDPACRGQDRYLRLDAVSDWVEAIAGTFLVPELECGAIGEEGRCLSGGALWCQAGLLQTADCTATGQACGWDPAQAGFRCVDPRADPCRGIDGVGACDGRTALTCIAGALETTLCSACESCRLDGRTGAPYCMSAE